MNEFEQTTGRVMCAIDVNDFDQDVIELASSFAEQFGVALDLVHVTLFPNPDHAAWPGYLGSPEQLIRDNQRLRNICPEKHEVQIYRHHLAGLLVEKILSFIERTQPQLLVLGTHGRRGLSRVFGSVAGQLVRKAPCPVLVLRQQQNSQQFADLKP